MRPTLRGIATLVFVSGLCSLVYQVAWLRLLRMIFGASTPATAVVLAIFMGGLGLGGILFGRRVERSANPLALYAWLEIGIATSTAASPLLIGLAHGLYLHLGGSSGLGLAGATAVRLALSVLVLGVPTVLMGGTLPAVAQAMERSADLGRRIVAGFYGVNTLGAVAGAFLTTFVLIELLGTRQTLWLVCLLNVLLGLVARSWARSAAGEMAPAAAAAAAAAPIEAEASGAGRSRRTRLLLAIAGLVGFIFFLMEIVWYRMLAPILGGSSYTFGLILTVALAGIGAGGWIYSRGAQEHRPGLSSLAWSCVLEAFFLALPFALGDYLTLFAIVVRQLGAAGFAALVLSWTLVVCVVVLPAALVAGYQFPLLVALIGSGRQHVGSEVGQAYAWNTWGAVLGSLAGGFGLLPLLTAPHLWRGAAFTLVGLGVALAALAARGAAPGRRLLAPLGCGLFAVVLALADGPSAYWRHNPVGAGRAELEAKNPNELRRAIHQARRSLVVEADGIESSVGLIVQGDLSLYVNGKSDGSFHSDAAMQVMGGLVGGVLHPRPENVLVIGLGTGMTAGWLARIATVERLDVIELEPAVAEFSRLFAPATFDVLDLPNVRLIYGDGREYVRTTSRKYDLIFSEPSNPYRAGVADLFSQEFYRAVAERLNPGGIFLHWLQGYEVDANAVRIVYATLSSVFPHVESWQVHSSDLLLVAAREPLVHDLAAIRRRVGEEPFASGMRWTWRVAGIEGFYSAFLARHGLTEALAEAAGAISTDDRPVLEFAFARNVGRTGTFRVAELRALGERYGAERPLSRGAPIDWEAVAEQRQVREAGGSLTLPPAGDLGPAGNARRLARAAYITDDLAAAGQFWLSQDQPATAQFDRFLIAEALAEMADVRAAGAIAELGAAAPTDAAFLTARLHWRRGEGAAAADGFVRAVVALRVDPSIYLPLVSRGLELLSEVAAADAGHGERLFEALGEPFAGFLFEELRRLKRLEIALANDFPRLCREAFTAFEPHVVWEENFLIARLRCYEAIGHPLAARARRELAEYLAAAPPRLAPAAADGETPGAP